MLRSRGSRGEGQINRNLAESLKSREIIIQPQILEDTQIEEDYSVGLTSWEGWQAENWTPALIDPERAPLRFTCSSYGFNMATQRGRARGR